MGIERYRAIVKLEDIRTLYEKGDYDGAKAAADSIRKERLKDSSDLFLLAAVYRKCGDYAVAKEFLYRIYEKKVTWRVLEELMEVCLAEKNPEEAKSYLQEYAKLSGGDPRNYIYEYRIGRQMHRPEAELLPLLQTLKAEEYSEKYAYELAKLYHKLGREEDCVAECADLILWFGEGTYVERAKALQAYYRGELSVDDIKEEADRRVREAEERRATEEEERKAYEAEQKRLAEEARLVEEARRAEEEEERRLAEEEHRALEAIWAGESVTESEALGAEEEKFAVEAELARFEAAELAAQTEEPQRFEEYEEAEAALADVAEEVAVTEMEVQEEATWSDVEPMWEPDASVAVSEETVAEEVQDAEDYEQISLFGAATETPTEEFASENMVTIPEEEPVQETFEAVKVLSEPSTELAARLSAKGIVLEAALHEFARIESVRKQLLRMLDVVVTVRKKCHCLIITGEKGSGKTTLGTYLAKLLYELSYVKSPRVAKINAEKLNGMKLEEKKEQLKNCCLIVEGAGKLTEEAADALLAFIDRAGVLGTVILEDNANAMSKFLRTHAECNQMFNNRVHLPKYDSSELMEFALGYIEEQDYEISREVQQVLLDKIEHITRVGKKEGRLVEAMQLVKQAIENADRRNQSTILAMASTGNFLAAGAMELTAEDFGVIR